MQCNKTSLAAETRTRAYYTSMCENRKGVSGLQPIRDLAQNENFLSIELSAEVNPLTLERDWML